MLRTAVAVLAIGAVASFAACSNDDSSSSTDTTLRDHRDHVRPGHERGADDDRSKRALWGRGDGRSRGARELCRRAQSGVRQVRRQRSQGGRLRPDLGPVRRRAQGGRHRLPGRLRSGALRVGCVGRPRCRYGRGRDAAAEPSPRCHRRCAPTWASPARGSSTGGTFRACPALITSTSSSGDAPSA